MNYKFIQTNFMLVNYIQNARYLSTPIFHNNFNYNSAKETQKSYKKQQFDKNNKNKIKIKNTRKYNSYQNMYKNLPIKSFFDQNNIKID